MSESTYTPEWEVYFCDIADRPACISVDLGLEALAPVAEKNRAFELVVLLQQPDNDGFPGDEAEWEILEQIEEAVVEAFQNSLEALFAGKILHDGKRSFYFYSAQEALPEVLATNVMQQFPGYTFTTNTVEDAGWGLYLDFLFPEPVDMQSIKNGRILRLMQEQGDQEHIPRPVSHFISFTQESDRAAFKQRAEEEGYTLVGENVNENNPASPYTLVISKVETLGDEDIHTATLVLWQLAEEYKGMYDGWESQVVKEND